MYRDADNYKNHGSVVFGGDYSAEEVESLRKRMVAAMIDGEDFVARQVGVPSVFLWDGEFDTSDSDHGLHEVVEVRRVVVSDKVTDARGRTFEQFVLDVESVGGRWSPEEPGREG